MTGTNGETPRNPAPAPGDEGTGKSWYLVPSGDAADQGTGQGQDGDQPLLAVLHYLRILWFRRWTIAAFVVVFMALGVIELRRTDAVYTSYTDIFYEPVAQQYLDFGPVTGTSWRARQDSLETAVRLIDSPRIADEVLKTMQGARALEVTREEEPAERRVSPLIQLRNAINDARAGLTNLIVTYESPPVDQEEASHQARTNRLLRHVNAEQIGETSIIRISAFSGSKEEAVRLANEFAAHFIAYIERENVEKLGSSRAFLLEAIAEAQSKLTVAERKLFDSSQRTDMRIVDESRETAILLLQELTRELDNKKKELAILQAELANTTNEDLEARVLTESELYRSLIARRSELMGEKAQREAVDEPGTRFIRNVEYQIEAVDLQIREEKQRYVESVRLQLEAGARVAAAQIERLGELVAEKEAFVDAIEKERIDFGVFQRQIDAQKQMYRKMLSDFEQLDASQGVETSRIEVISRATIPSTHSSPNIPGTMFKFSFMGFGLGTLFILGLSLLDRSVKDPFMVETRLRIPTLGFVPPLEQAKKRRLPKGRRTPVQVLEADSKRVEAEAFRYLRASLQYSSARHSPQVILVTSCYPKEGKSTIASNLGVFVAEQGRRTILIDADLKRPNIHRIFPKLTRVPGLTDVLTGQLGVADAISILPGNPNLHILPAGRTSPSPVTLLESGAMSDLLESLRKSYDTVILDSAPAFGMADAIVLSGKVDGVMLVVKQGGTPFEVLKKTSEKLSSVGARLLGAVYNAPERAQRGRGYGDQYGYYGYGQYGYGGRYGYAYGSDIADDDTDDSSPELASSETNKT